MNRSMRRFLTMIVCMIVAAGGLSRPGTWYVPAVAAGYTTANMTYHTGGPVMPNPKDYVIFWLPSGRSFEPTGSLFSDTQFKNLITQYFSDICGGNPLYNTLTQYSTDPANGNAGVTGGPIQNSCSFGGSYVDTTAFPSHFDNSTTTAGALNFSDLTGAVDRGVSHFSGGGDTNVEYFLYLPYGVNWCRDSSFCSFPTDSNSGYCAYHNYYTGGVNGSGTKTVYSVIADGFSGCSVGTSPNDSNADSYVNDTQHEQFESVSDVLLNAWYNGDTSHENGDQCNFYFGSSDKNSDGANFVINGDRYRMQWEWSNAIGSDQGSGDFGTSGCAPSLCGTSVCQATPTFNVGAATATIPGNPGDDAQITVSASDTSGFDGVYNAVASVPAPGSFSSGGPSASFGTLGVKGAAGPTTLHYTPTTWLPNGATYTFNGTFTAKDQLGNALPSLNGSVTIKVVNAAPTLDPVLDQTTTYSDAITPYTLSAHDSDAGDTLYYDASGLPSGLSIDHSTGTVSGTPTAVPNTYSVTYSVTDHHNPAVTQTSNVIVKKEDTQVAYTGSTTVHYHDPFTASATLTDPDDGTPVASRSITFTLGTDSCAASTKSSGVASCTITPSQTTASTIVASFAGDAYYLASSTSTSFSITPEETTMTYTGPTVILGGASSTTLSAQLVEDGANDTDGDGGSPGPIPSETVTLSVGSQSCTGTTDAAGKVSCSIPSVTVPLGPETVKAVFAGDAFYGPSSDSKTAIVFAFPSTGAFTLGDTTTASATPSTILTWWSSTWSSLNSLSGGSAPPAFKGFADSITTLPTTSPATVCGSSFVSSGGNSPHPPSSVPSYMGVLVTGSVTKSGNSINGTWGKIVVVKTTPGYAGNPGHPGTGTIVATFCH